jgi:hypothetical protein
MSGAAGETKRQRNNNRSRVHDSVNRPRLRSDLFAGNNNVKTLLRLVGISSWSADGATRLLAVCKTERGCGD